MIDGYRARNSGFTIQHVSINTSTTINSCQTPPATQHLTTPATQAPSDIALALPSTWRNVRESNPVNPLQVVRISSALHYRPAHVPKYWRKRWDSNPRYPKVRWFSRPDQSTALTRFQNLVRLVGSDPTTSPLSGVCSTN